MVDYTLRSSAPTVLVVGSCQARALAWGLSQFLPGYEVRCIELHETSLTNQEVYDQITTAELAIVFVLDEDKWEPLTCTNLRQLENVLLIPRIYFTGYHPDIVELSDDSEFPLEADHSRLLLASLLLQRTKSRSLNALREGAGELLGAEAIYRSSRATLLEKEGLADITVSDLVFQDRYRPLYTHRHPSVLLQSEWTHRVAVRAAHALGTRARAVEHNTSVTYFDRSTMWPVYPSLGLRFSNDLLFRGSERFNFRLFSLDQVYEFEASFYRQYKSVVRDLASSNAQFGELVERLSRS